MSAVGGRKKSVVSTSGVIIDQPVAHNTLLNKAASSSTSLYQQCSALRTRLLRIDGFSPFWTLGASPESSRRSTDPVSQIWDCFSTGISLCFLYNLLPNAQPIQCDTDPQAYDGSEKQRKRAIVLFSMATRQIPGTEQFMATELLDRSSTDGLVKTVNSAALVVDRLPQSVFIEAPPSPPPPLQSYDSTDSLATSGSTSVMPVPANAQEAARNNIIREMVETERKYVQDLEVMQKYSIALQESNTIDKDTIHLLFPNLNKLLNFQRRFLIRFEGTAEAPWPEQHWGQHFMDCEEEFYVYEPYCANYTNAAELMIREEESLSRHNDLINVKSELPAFLIKPVQRICKYPLLLESLVKAAGDYPLLDELKEGLAAAKRITDKINEAQRQAENQQTVLNLESRVEDWRGHTLSHFGALLLDDIFVVTKSDVDREYHVFLFEKIILCCKETTPPPPVQRKVGKSNSILKKQQAPPPLQLPGGVGPPKKKNTPLSLKGRIFLNNVTQAVPKTNAGYSLAVWWSGEDDLEFFTLRCRTEEQLKQWETQINRLIREIASRRAMERTSMSRMLGAMPPLTLNSTSPMPQTRAPSAFDRQTTYSHMSTSVSSSSGRLQSPSGSDEHLLGGFNGGPQGYPPQNAFDMDEDEFEDYPPAGLPSSGRGTPMGTRRGARTPGPYDDDQTSYRTSGYGTNGYSNGLPSGPGPRPSVSRLSSNAPPGMEPGASNGYRTSRPTLRSQFSSTRLKSAYENGATSPAPTNGLPPTPIPSRSRSASQPSNYIARELPPPLPAGAGWADRDQAARDQKRSSGSSGSGSSDYSPKSSSPITPYGSSDSSLGGSVRPSRSQTFDRGSNGSTSGSPLVKVKVHFHEDIFVIQVPRSTEYNDLVEKVGKKIRLCGPRRDDGPLRVKYRDEDGDMVSMGSTEDVELAFEAFRPGGQVTLYVT